MKLKDLKQYLSLIKDDEIEVSIRLGYYTDSLELLKNNQGELVLSNNEYEQPSKEVGRINTTTILKLNSLQK